jgi:hypothetical protein
VRNPSKWKTCYSLFQQIRTKTLRADKKSDRLLQHQYSFEEICAKTLYNMSVPPENYAWANPAPFDEDSADYVFPIADGFADYLKISRFDPTELPITQDQSPKGAIRKKTKGHAQQLGWSQRNSESNAKTIGARTASDGEFVFSTTAKVSKDEASHDCRGRIRAEFERNSIDWYVPLPQSNSFVPSQRRLKAESYPVEPSADVCKMPNTQLAR